MSPEEKDKQKQQQEKKRGGAGRKLFLGCLLVLVCFGGCAVGGVYLVRGFLTKAYKRPLSRAQKHSLVVEKLGEPISLGATGKEAKFQVSVPISGPKGEGILYFETNKDLELTKVTVTIKDTKEVITIVGEEEED